MKGYRSYIVNTLTAVAGLAAMPGVGDMIPPKYAWAIPAAQWAVAMIMRKVTTTPVGQAEP